MAGPLDEAFVEITAELDARQVQRTARTAGRAIERELVSSVRRAERTASRDSGRLGTQAGRGFSEGFGDGLESGFKRDVNGRLRDQFGRFINDGSRGGRSTGTAFGEEFGEGLSATLSSIAGIRLPVSGFAVFGGALAAAAASAVQLAAALAPAVGIITTLPSAVGVLAAGMSTLQVATLGVGEAFEVAATGTAEEFSEAMEGLAPNVQLAAQAIRDMTPALDELRDSVQQAFFEDFDKVLIQLSETLLGPVTDGMTSVAESMNGVITGLANVATSQAGVDFVNQSFTIMSGIIEQLGEPLARLFESLLNVGNAIGDAFGEDAGAGLAGLIDRLALFLDRMASGGQAVQWVNDAMKVFSALGDIISPIVGIVQSIGEAARTSGGNILSVFSQALGVFDDFLASAQGQEVLITIFDALNTVGSAFATVLSNIAPAIPPLVSGIASILSAVAPLLGPLSELVGALLTALAPILEVIAQAIQPIIPPLTEVITLLGGILLEAITAVMPLIEILVGLLGDGLAMTLEIVAAALSAVAPILSVLFEALGPVIEALAPLFEILGLVGEIIGAVLVPILTVLGDILLWVVENIIVPVLVPAIQFLADMMSGTLATAISFLVLAFQGAWEILGALFEWLKEQFSKRIDEMVTVFELLQLALQLGWKFIDSQVITPIRNGFDAMGDFIGNVLDSIEGGFDNFVDFVKGIPGKISSSLRSMFGPLWEGFRSAINDVIAGWNGLSFSVPTVDLGPLGSVGGYTLNLPNIPYLARGALATGPTLAMVGEGQYDEAILPLGDPRVESLLASALGRAGVGAQGTAGTDGASINAVGQSGDNYFVVKIGERELTDIVVEQQNQMNQDTLRRARAGTGRRV